MMQTTTPTRTSTTRRRSRMFGVAVVTTLVTVSGCAKAAEKFAENRIEDAIESEGGGDVDIDLGGDGGISFESDEGSVRIGEDGSFIIEGADGEVITGNADDEGFNVQSQDGENVFRADSGIPAEWPADVPRPDGLADIQGTYTSGSGFMNITVVGTPSGPASDAAAAYAGSLELLGYERVSFFEGNGVTQYSYNGPTYNVSLFASNDPAQLTVGLTPVQE